MTKHQKRLSVPNSWPIERKTETFTVKADAAAIDADAAGSSLGKIVNKQHVPGGDVQLTLHDGQTLVVEEGAPYDGGDSVVVSNDDGEIVAHFEYDEGALVTAVDGAHAGEVGTVETIQVTPGSASNNVTVAQDGGDGFETVEEYVVVIDENFTDDEGESPEDATDEAAADVEEGGDDE